MTLIAYSTTAMADRVQDEAEIRAVVSQINAAYTDQNAEEMASFLADDFQTWDGIRGRQNVAEAWANENDHYRQVEELDIRFVTKDVAIFRERGEAWPVADGDRPMPGAAQFIESWVLVKRNDKWLPTAFFYHRVGD